MEPLAGDSVFRLVFEISGSARLAFAVGMIGAAWLLCRQQCLPCDRGAQELCRVAFEAGCSAFPEREEHMRCRAASSWLAAALRSVFGMRPGKSKCGTRTWEIECFLERPRRADGTQRLSPCW